MENRIYLIRDRVLNAYLPQVMLASNDMHICRMVYDTSGRLKHPADYEVVHAGSIDLDTGNISPVSCVVVASVDKIISYYEDAIRTADKAHESAEETSAPADVS